MLNMRANSVQTAMFHTSSAERVGHLWGDQEGSLVVSESQTNESAVTMQVASLGSIVDVVIGRLAKPASAAPSTSSADATAASESKSSSREADASSAASAKAHAEEVKRLTAAVKTAEAAAAAAAEGQAFAAERLIEADQRLMELEAERDEVNFTWALLAFWTLGDD